VRTRGGGDLGALLTGYVEELRVRRYSVSSLEKARFELPRLIHHLSENGVRDARAVTEEHLVAYARHLEQRATRRGTPLAAASRASTVSTVRCFFAFLASRGHILRDPAAAIPLPRSAHLPRGILTESQARRLVAAPFPGSRIGKRDRAILELLYGTGIRLGEATRADVTDLDLRQGLLLVRSGKGKKDRVVPVPGRAAAALDTYLAEARPELVSSADQALLISRHGGRLSLAGVRVVVQRHGRAIGLDISPHALRHTCATHLLRGGASIRHVQEILGHRSLATTALYTRVAIEDLRQVLARAHPRR
jgi:integrase/recombinase XerD